MDEDPACGAGGVTPGSQMWEAAPPGPPRVAVLQPPMPTSALDLFFTHCQNILFTEGTPGWEWGFPLYL